MLEAGECPSISEIIEAEKIDRSNVSRLLRPTLLAPDIQEVILKGRQAKGMQLEELTRAMPGKWGGSRFSGGSSNRTLADFISHLRQGYR